MEEVYYFVDLGWGDPPEYYDTKEEALTIAQQLCDEDPDEGDVLVVECRVIRRLHSNPQVEG